jgi:RNA polymerase sigma-70 factor (ECF subfamily)
VPSDYPSASDEELARQSQGGCLAAFEQLVYRYEARIYAFTLQLCRNPVDAREVTQETFVRAFQAITQFDPRRRFSAWLFTIARRKSIDQHRAAPPFSQEPVPEVRDPNDPAELLARQEDAATIWDLARRHLSESQFQALWLRYVEDLDVAQIAQVLRKTQVHVKVLLFRARQALARRLKVGQASRLHPTTQTQPVRSRPLSPHCAPEALTVIASVKRSRPTPL